MIENRVKKVMREGNLAIGTYVTLSDPQVVEIIGLAGFDAAFIDMEHTTFDLSMVERMVLSAELVGITPIVRVPSIDSSVILRLLDLGTQGIIIPHVEGEEGARRAVDAVRYPPLGHRGAAGGTRAARVGTLNSDQVLALLERRADLHPLHGVRVGAAGDLSAVEPGSENIVTGDVESRFCRNLIEVELLGEPGSFIALFR